MTTKKLLYLTLCCLNAHANTNSFKVYDPTYLLDKISTINHDPKENGEYALLDYIIKPNDIVFDVGANVGEHTLHALKLNRNVSTYSFEPIEDVFRLLEINLNDFKNSSMRTSNNNSATTYNIGFYHTAIVKKIFYAINCNLLSSIYDRSNNADIKAAGIEYAQIDVVLDTIDNFCQKNKIKMINFLKIDVEGAEFDVLLGASEMLSNKTIENIQFEYGKTYLDSKYTLQQVFKYLDNFGYFLYKIVPNGLICMPKWENLLEDYRTSNILASKHKYINASS